VAAVGGSDQGQAPLRDSSCMTRFPPALELGRLVPLHQISPGVARVRNRGDESAWVALGFASCPAPLWPVERKGTCIMFELPADIAEARKRALQLLDVASRLWSSWVRRRSAGASDRGLAGGEPPTLLKPTTRKAVP
jgi:hypothetical protein